ncbi:MULTISPECIES: GNAT family N-acetyltransferase [unclassified Ornithinimicrobium]|uniref:GNAT family N-acetyltransferase n=1 Tax=unclassified Ornithinimicrobium TaxID=2615080 RepID=UPI0038536DCC
MSPAPDPRAAAYLLRSPVLEDVEPFATLHARVWESTYRGLVGDELLDDLSADTFRPLWYSVAQAYAHGTVPEDGRRIRVAVLDDEAAGWIMCGPARDENPPTPEQLWVLNVAPEHQGRGLGARLMDEVLGPGPAYLWVAQRNDRAVRFYERHGFALDGATDTAHGGMTEVRMARPSHPGERVGP